MLRPRRVLGYARVSSIAQAEGTSLADQQASIAAYAKTRGLKVDRFFVESESGIHEKAEKREQMLALMAMVREGDLVLCDKIDRWSRDPAFTYQSLRDILKAKASFYAVSDQMDPSTDAGDSMLNIRVLVAREEYKRIRERLIGTREKIRNAGYYVEGVVPFGYRRPVGVRGIEKNVLELDPDKAPIARRMFDLSARGATLMAIVAATGESRDRIRSVLHNRFHTGQMANTAGVWMPGRHQALVSVDVFEKSRDKLMARRHGGARPRSAPSQTDPWIIRDVAVCALCGARMASAYGGEPLWRTDYYRCAHKGRPCVARLVRRDAVEPEFAEMVSARLCEMRDALSVEPKESPKRAPVVDLAERRLKLSRKRARIVEAFTDGAMSRDEMRAAVLKVDAELARLDEATPKPAPTKEARRELLREVTGIRKAWSVATDKQRRRIVNLMTEKALIQRDKSPVAQWKPIDEVLQETG